MFIPRATRGLTQHNLQVIFTTNKETKHQRQRTNGNKMVLTPATQKNGQSSTYNSGQLEKSYNLN